MEQWLNTADTCLVISTLWRSSTLSGQGIGREEVTGRSTGETWGIVRGEIVLTMCFPMDIATCYVRDTYCLRCPATSNGIHPRNGWSYYVGNGGWVEVLDPGLVCQPGAIHSQGITIKEPGGALKKQVQCLGEFL